MNSVPLFPRPRRVRLERSYFVISLFHYFFISLIRYFPAQGGSASSGVISLFRYFFISLFSQSIRISSTSLIGSLNAISGLYEE